MALQPYHVSAYNTAKASENKIHDDATARRFGFTGGLVGGVHVYAYMTHLPVAHWGRAWLERGTGDCKFSKPVYEGDIAEITAEETADGLALTVRSHGELCATGSATLPVRRDRACRWPSSSQRRRPRTTRVPPRMNVRSRSARGSA